MKFGMLVMNQYQPGESMPEKLKEGIEQVAACRDAGFDLITLGQHYLAAPYQMPTSLPFLGRMTAVAGEMQVAASVILVPLHNPVEMAESVATLDALCDGRFIFGIGAGWLKEEVEIMGGTWGAKWAQTREAILAMKELWTKDEAEFHGKYYDFPPVMCDPKPVQQPHPPVFVGGNGPRALQRTAAWADGWFPVGLTPEQIRAGRETLDQLADAAGRDPKNIKIMVGSVEPDRDVIQQLEQAGADRVNVSLGRGADVDLLNELERIAQIVLR